MNNKTKPSIAVLLAGVALLAPSGASAASITVDSVSALNPNPSNLAITEIGNTTLTSAKSAVAAAHASGIGGTIDFQQKFQGGTFPNSTNTTNGIDFATDSASPLLVTTSSSGSAGNLIASGPVVFSFYRSDAITAGSTDLNDNVDSNLNQGANIISGGYKSRDPIAAGTNVVGLVDFTTVPPTPDAGASSASGSYLGITGAGSPATFNFNTTPLSFFAITALPRGATRDTLITLEQRPIGGGASVFIPIGAATVVGTSAVFFSQTAATGTEFIGAAITNPNGQGQNRYDDLAFIRSVPEPSSTLLGLFGALGLLRRRRR